MEHSLHPPADWLRFCERLNLREGAGPAPLSGDVGVVYPGNYLGMAGDQDPNTSATFAGCGGVIQGTGIFYSRSAIGLRDILDGTAQTIFLGERGIPHDLAWGWNICGGSECEHYVTSKLGLIKGNHRLSEYFLHAQHYWSWHPGAVYVALADGSVQSLTYSMDYRTYLALTTRAEGDDARLP